MIKKRVGLYELTTIHLKGWVDVNIIESTDDMLDLPESFIVIGGGSNLLIKNKKANFYKLSDSFSYVHLKDGVLICGGALKISKLMRFLIGNSVSSVEFLAGVPATIGGAVFMNAGAFGDTIENRIIYVKALCDDSRIIFINGEDIRFGYRRSSLDGCIIFEAGFSYFKTNREKIKSRIAENIKRRVNNAHLTNTFGSIFKNPADDYAGRLIEESGLKGAKRDSAMISDKHANYIVGQKQTNVDDVLFLIDKAKESVFKNFGIELEEEVKVI